MANIEMTNMCMIYDKTNRKVLVQERKKSWKGISFPGGHVEDGESIIQSTIREIKEETGLIVDNLKPCGIVYWFNTDTSERYIVFNYKTDTYRGTLLDETEEGKVFWVDVDQLPNLNLSRGLLERLPMFFEDRYNEAFGTWNKDGSNELTLY
jgi:8-oxo-dGTP diphosphatase